MGQHNERDHQASQRGSYPRDDDRGRNDDRGRSNGQGSGGGEKPRAEEALIPVGEYPVKCINHRIGQAGTKTEQIGVRLQIVDGEYKGKSMLWYGFFTDKAIETTIKAMRALGFTGNELKDCSSMYMGTAMAVVEHETGEDGKTRSRVRWINGADVMMKEAYEGNDLAAFSARMRGAFARMPGGAPAAAPQDDRGPSRDTRQSAPRDDRGNGQQRSFADDRNGRGRDDRPPPRDDDRPPFDRG